jgi:hypothetical protein
LLVSSVRDRARTDACELSASGPTNKPAYPNGQLRAGRRGPFAGLPSFGATVLAAVPARGTSLIPPAVTIANMALVHGTLIDKSSWAIQVRRQYVGLNCDVNVKTAGSKEKQSRHQASSGGARQRE